MLSDSELDDVKSKLDGGRSLQDIVTNDYSGNQVGAVGKQLRDKFTGPVIQASMMNARLHQLSVEELNTRIAQVQSRLNRITAIRDSKL